MVPILTVRELGADRSPSTSGSACTVTAEFDGYVILATDAVRADDAVEVHLAQWDDHDPRTTAGMVYLRVRDADAAATSGCTTSWRPEGRLFLAPAAGLTAGADRGAPRSGGRRRGPRPAARDRGQAVGPCASSA